MDVLSQLFSVVLNVLFSPFSEPAGNGGGIAAVGGGDSINNTGARSAVFPINLLRDAGVPVCRTMLFKMGENELRLSLNPRGNCAHCCTVQVRRDIHFVVYHKQRPDGVRVEGLAPGAARAAGIDPNLSTEIYIHGFTEPSPGDSGMEFVRAYLSRPDRFNVILLDWSELCPFPWYTTAVRNVRIVAKYLALFLRTFHGTGELHIETVHLVGFSLGSHIASFTGKFLQPQYRLPRITALDPAFPDYPLGGSSGRLSSSDANYIDVIHTDAGIFGYPEAVGHADFYPNGGRALQPGCQPSYLVQLRLIDQIFACSHLRAWKLYIESVRRPKSFPATRCPLWRGPNKKCNFSHDAFMGFDSDSSSRGPYYLLTSFKPPYSLSAKLQQRIP